jgi:thymidylate kinase
LRSNTQEIVVIESERGEFGRTTLIIFCGPDGAGKSTQLKLLTRYLAANNYRVKRSWIRALHSFALFLSRIVIGAGFYRIVSNPYGGSYRAMDLKRVPPLRKLWPYVEIFSMLPVLFYRVKLPSAFGWIVLTERFTIDSVAAISWLIEDESFPNSRLANLLLGFTPKGSCIINLDCDYDEIMKRRGKIAEPRSLIETQREIYSNLARKLPIWTIDTSKHSVQETQKMIQDLLWKKCLRKKNS